MLKQLDEINQNVQQIHAALLKKVEEMCELVSQKVKKQLGTFEGRTYAFSSSKAKWAFCQKPKKYVNELLLLCIDKPPFIDILNLRSRLEEVENIESILEDKNPKFLLCKEVQCDADYESFVPPPTSDEYIYDITDLKRDALKIDKLDNFEKTKQMVLDMLKIKAKYRWNTWDMRKDALELAKLTCCRTVAVQTTKTHSRIPERLQTYFPREKTPQTRKDNYSNTPKPSTFIFGLRNQKPNNQFLVDLTLPVDM
nr:unnamed protein product [Callosobruchus analis]